MRAAAVSAALMPPLSAPSLSTVAVAAESLLLSDECVCNIPRKVTSSAYVIINTF